MHDPLLRANSSHLNSLRRWVIAAAALMTLAFCTMPIGCRKGGSDSKLANVIIRLKWVHQAQFAGFYAAKEEGLYEKAGMNVDIRPGGVDFPAIQMVASGSEDFGIAGADQILLARAKGVPIVAVAAIYRDTPFVLFGLKRSNISSIKDLVGKRVGVKLGGNEELTYRAMLEKAGVDSKQIHEIPVKFDISPLLVGDIDVWPGYVINEVVAARENGADVTVISPSSYGINFYADTLFTTEGMIARHPDEVKKFVQVTMAGWDYALKHPDEAAGFGLKYNPELKLEHEKAMMAASIPMLRAEEPPLGKMRPAEWQSLQGQLLQMSFLQHPQDLEKVYTNKFIENPGVTEEQR